MNSSGSSAMVRYGARACACHGRGDVGSVIDDSPEGDAVVPGDDPMGDLIDAIVQAAIDNATKPKLPADGYPAAPAFRPGNWVGSQYIIASGDTLAGLARLYLGDPRRWKDIWALNSGSFASPDAVPVNARISMPPEAKQARDAMLAAHVPGSPATSGPSAVPGAPDPGDPSKPTSTVPKALIYGGIGAGVLGAAGLAFYAGKHSGSTAAA